LLWWYIYNYEKILWVSILIPLLRFCFIIICFVAMSLNLISKAKLFLPSFNMKLFQYFNLIDDVFWYFIIYVLKCLASSIGTYTWNPDLSCDKWSYHERCELEVWSVIFSKKVLSWIVWKLYWSIWTIFTWDIPFINDFVFANYFGIHVVDFCYQSAQRKIWHFTSLLNLFILMLSI
jgi:hypothetical protein